MKKTLIAALVVGAVVAAALLGGDRIPGLLGFAEPQPSATSAPAIQLVAPPQRTVLFALDPTTSTDGSFAAGMKAAIILAVEQHLPPKPAEPLDGVPAVTGFELAVRLVTTAPLAYGQPLYRASIPSVPALPPIPDLMAEGATDHNGPYQRWTEAKDAWSAAWDDAVAKQAEAVAAMQAIDLSLQQDSGITAATSALAQLVEPGTETVLIIASDLEETVPSQVAGSLGGAPVIVIQANPWGDAAIADAYYSAYAAFVTTIGAGEITRVVPDLGAAAISGALSPAQPEGN